MRSNGIRDSSLWKECSVEIRSILKIASVSINKMVREEEIPDLNSGFFCTSLNEAKKTWFPKI